MGNKSLIFLLDTHIFVWAVLDVGRIDRRIQAVIESPDHEILVSAVTPWEISVKQARGRIDFPLDRFDEIIAGMGFEVLAIQCTHGITAGRLPRHHHDPFDRMLIAQAMTDDLTLISADRAFDHYDVPVLGNASH